MSNYTKTTNFATKDSLPSGNPAKIVKGTEINTEFDNIAVASATKLNSSTVSTFGATLIDDANASAARTTLGLGTAATTASTDYATAAQGTTADAALPKIGGAMTGAITTNSTFDGRDVATDGTKLDGIEASADVTDTTNVTAAGALMDSEVTNLAQVKAFDSTDYATAAQGTLATNALPKAGGTITTSNAGSTTALTFKNGTLTSGKINTHFTNTDGYLSIGNKAAGLRFIDFQASRQIAPYNVDINVNSDNLIDLGSTVARFDDIYATNSTIQTSDRNEKQDIEELTDAETRVAVACKGLLRKFRWKSAVEEKGTAARTHFGIIAQDLQAAFEAEGLDAGNYAMFISTTWTNEDGEEQTRMGVRYSELLAFIIGGI